MSSGAIPTLFETAQPREDVLQGQLAENQFAASLADVAHKPDSAPAVYADPGQFFEKTYPTDGLRTLLERLSTRFTAYTKGEYSGTNGVLRLDTSFGGGKTHNQIAAYHLAKNPRDIPQLADFLVNGETADAYRGTVEKGLDANTAVFVGAHVDATDARCDYNDPNAPNTNTMWGELAYQLFGREGYEFLKENDENRNPPGSNKLERLFEGQDNPSLILLDEIAAYLVQTAAVDVGDSNLARQTNVFLMSLLEATQNTDGVTVVLSIADTAFGEQAEVARQLVDDFNSITDRTESSITPTGDDEIASVLGHRLFESIDLDSRGNIAAHYAHFYDTNAEAFPEYASAHEFREQLADCFPIHPTVIDTLTEELDSLPSFQRTRGALKLLSRGIYRLWETQEEQNEDRHFVRLFDLHPSDSDVHSTLLGLFQSVDVDFEAAIKADIHSERGKANAEVEDQTWLAKGHPPLGTQITTTVLWKSIVIGSGGRGTNRRTLSLSVAHPEVELTHYEGALNNLLGGNMDSACFYLFDEQKLRFKSEANINKLIESEAERIQSGVARDRLNNMLSGILGDGDLDTKQGPEEPHQVPDEMDTVNLCVMDFDTVTIHADRGDADKIPEVIETLYENTAKSSGGQTRPREYKNNIVFLAPDVGVIPEAKRTASRVAAIERIQRGLGDKFDLNSQQIDELGEKLDTASTDLARAIKRAYRHLYYPTEDGLAHTPIHSVESSEESHIHDVVLNALKDDEKVLLEDSGAYGGRWFKSTVWNKGSDRMSTRDIEKQFAKRRDAPILLSPIPLRETIANLVEEKGYAYWNTDSNEGNYTEGDTASNLSREVTEAKNLTTGMSVTQVALSGSHYLYESLDDLVQKHKTSIEFPEKKKKGRDGPGGDGSGGDGPGGDGPDGDGPSGDGPEKPLPMSMTATAATPVHVSRALEELRTDVDTDIQSLIDEHNYHRDDIAATVSSLTITTRGEEAWQHTWFITNKLADNEDLSDYTRVEFQYDAVDNQNDPAGQVGLSFTGSASKFASHFRFSQEPTSLVGPDGERTGEGQIIINLSNAVEPADYEDTFESLDELLAVDNGFTVRMETTVRFAEVEEEEVTA